MPWLALRVEVERGAADTLSDALIEAGAQSVAVEWPERPIPIVNAFSPSRWIPTKL